MFRLKRQHWFQAEQGSTAMHGTVSHMPPEALSAPNIISTKTDIWSFGIVMWEVWTGQLPYAGLQPQKVVAKILAGDVPPWPENTPPIWRSLAARCCSNVRVSVWKVQAISVNETNCALLL